MCLIELKRKFVFQTLDGNELEDEEAIKPIKQWALEDMSSKWRSWKNELKSKYCDEDKTPEQMYEAVNDSRVDKNQFLQIAAHWLTNEAKVNVTTAFKYKYTYPLWIILLTSLLLYGNSFLVRN